MDKKRENVYRKSRESHKVGKNKCLTITQAAATIPVDTKTLAHYETFVTVPAPDVVCQMSKIYNDPALRRYYCSEICEIGKTDQVYSNPHSLYSSGYKLINANSKLEEVKTMLFGILADGKIDDDEMIVLNNDIPNLIKEVKLVLNEIEIEIEKKEYLK